ncbi:hypothetical protein C6Y62_07535 [Hyphomicrobium sulfonivorans]|nr:hypothetical protein [Hyphomicrobium sulfonivorans]
MVLGPALRFSPETRCRQDAQAGLVSLSERPIASRLFHRTNICYVRADAGAQKQASALPMAGRALHTDN